MVVIIIISVFFPCARCYCDNIKLAAGVMSVPG